MNGETGNSTQEIPRFFCENEFWDCSISLVYDKSMGRIEFLHSFAQTALHKRLSQRTNCAPSSYLLSIITIMVCEPSSRSWRRPVISSWNSRVRTRVSSFWRPSWMLICQSFSPRWMSLLDIVFYSGLVVRAWAWAWAWASCFNLSYINRGPWGGTAGCKQQFHWVG